MTTNYAGALWAALNEKYNDLMNKRYKLSGIRLMRSEVRALERDMQERGMLFPTAVRDEQIMGLPLILSDKPLAIEERFVVNATVELVPANVDHVSSRRYCPLQPDGPCEVDLGDCVNTTCQCGMYIYRRDFKE